jgi:integrase/recombinase XerD
MNIKFVDEFQLDWHLEGKSKQTAKNYAFDLRKFLKEYENPTLSQAKEWVLQTDSIVGRRKRAQAIRAFGKWLADQGIPGFEWHKHLPLTKEKTFPQKTVTKSDYEKALINANSLRDKAIIEVLWSCGLRRTELAVLEVTDIDFLGGYIVVRQSKTGKPRIVPLSPNAKRALRRYLQGRTEGSLFKVQSNTVRLILKRLNAPSAHAWRRGWAVQALRSGVSETSVRAAAGWSSGAMVARYTRALSGELAVEEFQRSWKVLNF